ncbi:unnamed protein product [Prorocentrum cordatum]|uniref:Uncharacterized protein n=1 Tax=Prorocentrum cordatum TaxID=2364126 RepID=A0ABN9TWX7_9DINO|nr:unnamed protein product [Polarella glacialis]
MGGAGDEGRRARPPTSLTWDRATEATINIKGLTREGYAVYQLANQDLGRSLHWLQDHWLAELGVKNYGAFHKSERRKGLFQHLSHAHALDAGSHDLGGSGGVTSVSVRTDLMLPWLLYKFVHSSDDSGRSPISSTIGAWLQISVDGLSRVPAGGACAVEAHSEGRLTSDCLTLDFATGAVAGWGEAVAGPRLCDGWAAFLAGAGKLSHLRARGDAHSVVSVLLFALSNMASRVGEPRQRFHPGAQAVLAFCCKALAMGMEAYILFHHFPLQDPAVPDRLEELRCIEHRRRLDPQAIVAAMRKAREVAGSSYQTVTAVTGSKDLDSKISYTMARMHRDMMKNAFRGAASLAMAWDPGGYSRRSYNVGLVAQTAASGDPIAGPSRVAVAADFAFKTIRKKVDLQFIADDPELNEAWASDKMDKEAAFLNMIVVLTELAQLTDRPLTDFCLAPGLNLRPVQNEEKRLLLEGVYVLFNESRVEASVEMPPEFWTFEFPIVSHTTDRSSINSSLLHFLIAQKYLYVPWFDPMHALWNSLKNSAKRVGPWSGRKKGYMWKKVLEFVTICNMNSGPHRSGQWFDLKKDTGNGMCSWDVGTFARLQDACRRWCQIYNEASPEFLEVAHKFGAAIGVDAASKSGIEEISGKMGTSRGATDGDVQREISKQAGTIKKAFSFISDDMYSALSVFCASSRAQRRQYGHRASEITTIAPGRDYDYKLQAGAWKAEFIQTVITCMNDVAMIGEMGLKATDDPDGKRGAEAFEFMVRVLKERYDSIAPELFGYPGKFRLALGRSLSPQDRLRLRRDIINFDWKLILEVEKASLSRADAKQVLGDIFWARWPINRLTFGQNERELEAALDITDGFIRTATAATEHWPDSKGPEDVHQHIRDEGRAKRNTTIAPNRLYRAQQECNIAGSRGMKTFHVSDEEVSHNIYHRDNQESIAAEFRGDPSLMPPALRRILDRGYEYSSPSGQSYAKAQSAWAWLQAWANMGSERPNLLSSWHGRMVPELSILLHPASGSAMVVVSQQLWSLFVCDLDRGRKGDVSYFRMRSGAGAFHDYFVTDPTSYKVVNISKVMFLAGVGKVLLVSEEPMTPLAASLLAGIPLALDHMNNIAALMGLDLGESAKTSAGAAREKLTELTFAGFPDLIAKCTAALHAHGENDLGAEELGEDFISMLDEILAHDAQNCSEIQAFRTVLKQQRVKRMVEKRNARRDAKKAAAIEKGKKKLAKGKLASGVGAKLAAAKALADGDPEQPDGGPAGGAVGGFPGCPTGAGGAEACAASGGCGGGSGGAPGPMPLPHAPPGGHGAGAAGIAAGSGEAPPLPPPHKKPKIGKADGGAPIAHGSKLPRSEPFGPWQIAEVYTGGVCVGWEARCLDHTDPATPHQLCVKHCTMGKGKDGQPALSYETCRRRMKQWLLIGRGIPENQRTRHVYTDARTNDLLPSSEAELDAAAAAELRKRKAAAK